MAYTLKTVGFNSCRLTLSSLSCTNNNFFGFAGWFKSAWLPNGSVSNNVAWVVDPLASYAAYLAGFGGAASTPAEFYVQATSGNDILQDFDSVGTATSTWNHIIGAVNTTFVTDPVTALYVDGVKQSPTINHSIFDFICDYNGLPIYFGDDGTGKFWVGCMADVSIWIGIDLLQGGSDIPSTVRRAFTDTHNNPLDPNTAITLLGKPPVFLTGDSSTFANNTLGTSGAFTIAAGSLSNNCPPPAIKGIGSAPHRGDKRRRVDINILRSILRDAGSPWAAELAKCDVCREKLQHLGGDDYYCHSCDERIQATRAQEAEQDYNAQRSKLKIPRCIMDVPCDCGELCEDEQRYGWLVGKG